MQSTVPLRAERRYYLATSPRNAMSSVFIPPLPPPFGSVVLNQNDSYPTNEILTMFGIFFFL